MKEMQGIAIAAAQMKGEAAFTVLARAQALESKGKNIVHLEIGQPDFATPASVVEAGIDALRRGETGYAPTLGLPELREAIAKRESKLRGYSVDPSHIIVTPGAKTDLFLIMAALLEPGDELVYPDPGFPAYENIGVYLKAVLKPLPLLESKNFSFDREEFARLVNDRTKLVILNSPSNPTGGVIPAEDLAFIAELALKHDFFILSDEIYSELSFLSSVPSPYDIEAVRDRVLVASGFSKTYAMPGWRLGYVIAPPDMMRTLEILAVNVFSCTATFTQRAGIVAAQDFESVVSMREEYRRRRDYLTNALNHIPGVSCFLPGGAFYVFPNIMSFGASSKKIADYLLEESGLALLPGTGFGAHGEGYLRLSFAASQTVLEEGVRRIKEGLKSFRS